MSDPVAWYEDPCFDDMHEAVGGKCVRGDAWRRLQFLRERGVAGELIAAAGTTFRAEGVRRGAKRGARAHVVTIGDAPAPHTWLLLE